MLEDASAKGLFYHVQLAEPAAQVVATVAGLSSVVCIGGQGGEAGVCLDELLSCEDAPPESEHLGRHEVPRRVLIVDALARNAAGKVLKRELRREGEIERGADHPPKT
jgi:acyl-CoA synthetase (AMP-forming)/AMP-acid ligase II